MIGGLTDLVHISYVHVYINANQMFVLWCVQLMRVKWCVVHALVKGQFVDRYWSLPL
jgi:hypothetical protein